MSFVKILKNLKHKGIWNSMNTNYLKETDWKRFVITVMRMVVGWHFLYEGITKLVVVFVAGSEQEVPEGALIEALCVGGDVVIGNFVDEIFSVVRIDEAIVWVISVIKGVLDAGEYIEDVPGLSELASTTRRAAGLVSRQPLSNPWFILLVVLLLGATWVLRRRWGRR